MDRRDLDRPTRRAPSPRQTVALVGCGNYAYGVLAHFLTRKYGHVIAGCMDIDLNKAISMARDYKIPVCTDQFEELLALDTVSLVFIASNHATHAEYAVRAMRAGKDVYIEKPHVVNEQQLDDLLTAMRQTGRKVFLGFNRPDSRFGGLIRRYLAAQPGSGMYNWFVAGHHIEPGHWYFRQEEGGRVLGNLCHWTDFLLRLPHDRDQIYPLTIIPVRGATPDFDISVNYRFADGSIYVITFSAKGATFEGVSERFNAQRGDCILSLDDFKSLEVKIAEKSRLYRSLFRDHGHRDNVLRAYECVVFGRPYDAAGMYRHIAESARLFLLTRDALVGNQAVTVTAME